MSLENITIIFCEEMVMFFLHISGKQDFQVHKEFRKIIMPHRNWFHPILQHSSKSQVPLHSIHYD